MTSERTMILEMLAAGRVTVDQADQLLDALGAAPAAGAMREPEAARERQARSARKGGVTLTPAQLIELRNHDISGSFVQQMRAAWPGALGVDDLIALHNHDVTVSFVRAWSDVGLSGLTRDEIITLRNHDIDAAFVREMRGAGLDDVTVDQLVELHDHDVDASFVREMREQGFATLAPDELVELRDQGVEGHVVRGQRGLFGRQNHEEEASDA